MEMEMIYRAFIINLFNKGLAKSIHKKNRGHHAKTTNLTLGETVAKDENNLRYSKF
jgi:hypothetical protein